MTTTKKPRAPRTRVRVAGVADVPSMPSGSSKKMPSGVLWEPGQSGNPGGRPAGLPHWFKDRGPEALMMTLAAATGRVVELEGITSKAHRDMATDAPLPLRAACAKDMREAIYGKSPDVADTGSGDALFTAMLKRWLVSTGDASVVIDVTDPKKIKS